MEAKSIQDTTITSTVTTPTTPDNDEGTTIASHVLIIFKHF